MAVSPPWSPGSDSWFGSPSGLHSSQVVFPAVRGVPPLVPTPGGALLESLWPRSGLDIKSHRLRGAPEEDWRLWWLLWS